METPFQKATSRARTRLGHLASPMRCRGDWTRSSAQKVARRHGQALKPLLVRAFGVCYKQRTAKDGIEAVASKAPALTSNKICARLQRRH